MADKEFSFDELNKEMSKASIMGERLDLSEISSVDHYIHTGNYMLNACMTGSINKGIPNNRAIAFAGPSGTGKTFLLLNALKQAQDMGYYIIFYDSENAVDRELVERFGIDPKRFRYEPVGTVQEFRKSVTNLTELLITKKRAKLEIPKILIALDSAGNLATQKEIDDASSGSMKADMTRAKVLKSIFRILMHRLAIIKAPFIFTNHTYLTQSMYAQTVSGGGTGPEYAASIILFLSKAQLKDGDLKTGIIMTVKPNKNRFSVPENIKIHVDFHKGMNPYVGLEKHLSWDFCGIAIGQVIGVEEMNKIIKRVEKEKDEKKKAKLTTAMNKIMDTQWEFTYEGADEPVNCFYVTHSTGEPFRIAGTKKGIVVKHLGRQIENSELFTGKVFTKEIRDLIDEHMIRPKFEYKLQEHEDLVLGLENIEEMEEIEDDE